MLDEDASLEDLIGNGRFHDYLLKMFSSLANWNHLAELFERDIADPSPAELYFEDSFDLIRIFRAMESQNLNALIHLESLAAPMADMATTITVTEEQIKREINEITSAINDLEVRIRFKFN